MSTQTLTDLDGAVLSASAANADRHVATVILAEAGEPGFQIADDILHHLLGFRMLGEKLDDRLLLPGKAAQGLVPMGIGQAAHVEDHVSVHGNPMLEAERLEQQRQVLTAM